jgi:uncharacterized protein YkwD
MRLALFSPRLISTGLFAGLVLVVGSIVAGGRPAPAFALTNCTVSDLSVDVQEQAFFTLINNYRTANGKVKLTMSSKLNRMASWHSADMATKNYFSHTDSANRSVTTRASQCDTAGGVGENIAAGTAWDTAQEAFDAWKNSPGHNSNMLNSSYKQIGIARFYSSTSTYKWYWVTDFSLYNDGTSIGGSGSPTAPTPTPPPTSATPTAVPAGTKATITSPSTSTLLLGNVNFQWSTGTNAQEYRITVGTTRGGTQVTDASTGLTRSKAINVGTARRTLYVRLYTRIAGVWQYNDYVYRAGSR